MTQKTYKKDSTGNQRQARRREREKQWLKENGWRSWEALHTALMNGTAYLTFDVRNTLHTLGDRRVSDTTSRC